MDGQRSQPCVVLMSAVGLRTATDLVTISVTTVVAFVSKWIAPGLSRILTTDLVQEALCGLMNLCRRESEDRQTKDVQSTENELSRNWFDLCAFGLLWRDLCNCEQTGSSWSNFAIASTSHDRSEPQSLTKAAYLFLRPSQPIGAQFKLARVHCSLDLALNARGEPSDTNK